jgi:membrane-bound lytic murein transglycosylase D
MIQLHKRCLVLLAVIVGSSFLPACSGTQFSSSVSPSVLESNNITSPISSADETPAELEACMQQELDALRRTGTWKNSGRLLTGTKDSPVNSDFPVIMNRQVQMYIDFFQNEHKKLFTSWLSKSKQYLPMMQRELKSAGLPLDLAYLAMIESGFNQKACSSAQATGLWQFMADTGRQYNLRIDSYVDERRNAEKSTKAAVAMLGNLYREFGDWNLAVAAYNAGPGKIGTGLKKYNVNTFWDLAGEQYLSLETIRYVPELMAAIIIAKDPEKYGFTDINYTSLPAYETLEVGPGMGFDGLALLTNSSKEDIQALNHELIAGKTPLTDRKFQVKIPAGTRAIALNNLPRLRTIANIEYKNHIIGRHETLATIGKKYDISQSALLKANSIRNKRFLAGQSLRIPVNTVRYHLAQDKVEAIAKIDNNSILHEVRLGETQQGTKLRTGQQIVLHQFESKEKIQTTTAGASHSQLSPALLNSTGKNRIDSPIMLAANKKNFAIQTARDEFKWYQIENGDTLWTISQKFKTSLSQLKDWNNLKSNEIHPGDKLKIKEPNSIIAERKKNTVL